MVVGESGGGLLERGCCLARIVDCDVLEWCMLYGLVDKRCQHLHQLQQANLLKRNTDLYKVRKRV